MTSKSNSVSHTYPKDHTTLVHTPYFVVMVGRGWIVVVVGGSQGDVGPPDEIADDRLNIIVGFPP